MSEAPTSLKAGGTSLAIAGIASIIGSKKES